MDDTIQLMLKGKIDEAIAIYSRRIEKNLSSSNLDARGFAYLYQNQLDKALADFEMAEKVSKQVNLGPTDGYLQDVGIALWLKGKEQEAADVWHGLVQDHLAGKIEYSDRAGGVESGNLLWFAACFEKFRHYQKPAEKLLKKKCKLKRIKYWPGPVAQYLLGNISEENLKVAARESGSRAERHLCQASFYIGAKALLNGDKRRFREAMAEVTSGELSFIEKEYYLARHELSRNSE